MTLYRKTVLWAFPVRLAFHLAVICVIGAVIWGAHRYIDDSYDAAKRADEACNAWLAFDGGPRDKSTMISRSLTVLNYCRAVEGVDIHYFDGQGIRADLPAKTHLSYEGSFPYAEIVTDTRLERVFIAFPKGNDRFRWMHQFPQAQWVTYIEYADETRRTSRKMVFDNARELAGVALAYLSVEHAGFRSQLLERKAEAQTWIARYELAHQPLVAALIIALLVCCVLPVVDMFPEHVVERTASEYELEAVSTTQLTQAVREAWLAGISREGIRRRANALAKRLRREQNRAADKHRREQLRALTSEANAKRLADLAEAKARQARERIQAGETTIGAALSDLRSAMGSQDSDVARLAESGFFQAITEPHPRRSPRSEERALGDDEPETERDKAERAIHSCSHTLKPLDAYSDADLVRLAHTLRLAKRKANREAWRELCRRFGEETPVGFLSLVAKVAEQGDSALRNQETLARTASGRLPRVANESVPPLLAGMKVILLGGDPGLEPFYGEQIARLGGTMLLHHVGGNPVRLRNFKPDLFLLIFQRTDHKCQHVARSMGIKIVWLTKLSKSSFLTGAIEDIRAQL